MRVIHVISGDLWAGAAVQVFHTLRELNRVGSGLQVGAVLFNSGILLDRLSEEKVTVYLVDEAGLGPFQMVRGMAEIFAGRTPEILHVHSYKEHILGFLACIASRQSPSMIRTFHGRRETPKSSGIFRRVRSEATHAAERFLLGRSGLVAVSRDLEQFLRTSYPDTEVRQIYNGIQIPEKASTGRGVVRSKFGIPDEVCWIATAARLEPVKNISLLLDSVGILLREGPKDWVLSVFGDGPERQRLEAQSQDLELGERVRFHGFHQPMGPVLDSIDLFALSSVHEGLPMALVEAMAHGAVPVCTEVGGIGEVLSDGENGILVPSGDAPAMAKALGKLIREEGLRLSLSEEARGTVLDRFEIGRTCKALTAYYQSVRNERA